MIVSLAIRGLGVIDDAEVSLGPGLTVITGETGAGKTMVLSGLALLLGGKADAGAVRPGHGSASVEGRFDPSGGTDALASLLDEAGGAWDEDGSLLAARTVSAEGRSRAHLGGRSVPAASLAALGRLLVAVHGQDDQHRLLQPAQQRAALDRFGGRGLESVLQDFRTTYAELVSVSAQLADVVEHARERAREAEDLAEMLAMIVSVDPQPGEEEALKVETQRLSHADELAQSVTVARDVLAESADSAASDLLDRALGELARAATRDASLDESRARLEAVRAEIGDIAADLTRYLDALEADPARLARLEERRASLGSLRRRLERFVPEGPASLGGHPQPSLSGLVEWRAQAETRLAELGDDETLVVELRARQDTLRDRASELAGELSALRREAGDLLAAAVTAELHALAMPNASLEVAVRLRGDRGSGERLEVAGQAVIADRHGVDEVEFLLVPRPGSPARPLGKGASGGERSRIMLALEVVFAGIDPVPTFVFDEVDAGVGGKAAVEVGRRLAMLARSAQVLVVTHLPQVAAFATRHLVVRPGQAVTSSSVEEVQGDDRARELARMLAGLEGSAMAVAHAEELLALAAAESAAGRGGREAPGR
ncbi:MAG: DNA repair protein RecN [Candidatus Nanopelagicales bacterium]